MSSTTPRLSNDRVATILVEALFFGDIRTANKWGIHKQTIHNYRKRLSNDTNGLVTVFENKRQLFQEEWIDDVPVTVRLAMDYIKRASQEADITPENIHAIAGALKIVAEVGLTKEMLDVRFEAIKRDRQMVEDSRPDNAPRVIEGEIETVA